jgi:calcineurin-like phosphoesterase family protein
MRYFTSDLHFYHQFVYKKFRSEYSTIEDMHEGLIRDWNQKVRSHKDVVFVIGDVSFGNYEQTKAVIERLNGKKILIRGNHDERFTSAHFIQMGFIDVRDQFLLKCNGQRILLSHFPYASPIKYLLKSLRSRRKVNYYSLYPAYKGLRLIHGHHHSGPVTTFRSVNVAWDIHRKLLSEPEIMQLFEQNEQSRLSLFLQRLLSCCW